ncbi:polysaccharide pyruvyl transferase family protein [Pseudarthrobacter enclensis]|uniref:polysaccharide pyruvyl transferase family protein n=1 Tax=Pseudarthrobacter enclensis TaxID=993070 RepID=UPI003EE1F5C7
MNVGDSMIWAGELAYLDQLGAKVRYICDVERYSPIALAKSHPDGPILLHGGGNLGDIWPRFQEFRERVVLDFPSRQIIQLPQTLYFASTEKARRADQVFGGHADFTLMLRDWNSVDRAKTQLPSVNVEFVPDMALGWQPPAATMHAVQGTLILARQDAEAKSDLASLSNRLSAYGDVEVADWGLTSSNLYRWKASRIPGSIARRIPMVMNSGVASTALKPFYNSMIHMNLQAGVKLFSNRSLIVTDRLHAHVLAGMMNVPHVVFDNSYGKVKSIFDDYTGEFASANYAADYSEALQLAESVLKV